MSLRYYDYNLNLNLNNKFDGKIHLVDGRECLLCNLRKQLTMITPEEIIRQELVNYLIEELEVPKYQIEVEVQVSNYKKFSRGRADIIVSDKNLSPLIVIECKSSNVILTDDVWEQVIKYNKSIKAPYIMISNGIENYLRIWDECKNKYIPVKILNNYRSLANIDDSEKIIKEYV